MCHENFFLRFGPHVTFINGTNGSGKSAILQGMQFCLGMQAAKTGRAGDYVKLSLNGPSACLNVCATATYVSLIGMRDTSHLAASFPDTLRCSTSLSRMPCVLAAIVASC